MKRILNSEPNWIDTMHIYEYVNNFYADLGFESKNRCETCLYDIIYENGYSDNDVKYIGLTDNYEDYIVFKDGNFIKLPF